MSRYVVYAVAGFRRHATYRQAMIAALCTNCVFGFLRFAVMSAVVASTGVVAGYDQAQLATFVWAGQGLIGVVSLWAPTEFADRIRSGDVVSDLLRPIDLVWQHLATDLGRGAFAIVTRFVGPVVLGGLLFDFFVPRHVATYAVFACSVLLATVICFGCRFLVNAAAYWLLDARGPQIAWSLVSGVLGGLYFPLWFLPSSAALAIIVGTPFPSVIQLPLDVLLERGGLAYQLLRLATQLAWAVVMLVICRCVQRLGERKLVVQGG